LCGHDRGRRGALLGNSFNLHTIKIFGQPKFSKIPPNFRQILIDAAEAVAICNEVGEISLILATCGGLDVSFVKIPKT
jgi:hypothetical protein